MISLFTVNSCIQYNDYESYNNIQSIIHMTITCTDPRLFLTFNFSSAIKANLGEVRKGEILVLVVNKNNKFNILIRFRR